MSSEDSLEALAAQLDAVDSPADRRDLATRIVKRHQEGLIEGHTLPGTVIDRMVALLDDPDPGVRVAAAMVVRFAAAYPEDMEADVDSDTLYRHLFDRIDDKDWCVRQAAINPDYLGGQIAASFGNEERSPARPAPWLAERLLERFTDPEPAIRKRVAGLLLHRQIEDPVGVELVKTHPDPPHAVEQLADGLADPATVIGNARHAQRPATAAIEVLTQLVDDRPHLVTEHLDSILGGFDRERGWFREQVINLLAALLEAGAISLDDIDDDVVDALHDGQYPVTGNQSMRLLVDVALSRPATAGSAAKTLLSTLGTATGPRPASTYTPAADALARLERNGSGSFDPVVEKVAELAAERPFEERDTDPLVVLAADHPGFVADQLQELFELAAADELPNNNRLGDGLVADVAAANPRAVKPALPALTGGLDLRTVQHVLDDLAADHPELVADIVPNLTVHSCHRYYLGRALARAADAGAEFSAADVTALVESVDTDYRNTQKTRYWAAKTLVTLAKHDHDGLPGRTEALLGAARAGDLDDPNVDPLDLPDVRSAGWGPGEN
ncbi:hypothetical protein BVU17_17860 (plasmid) [Haloarcula taiwanensis]|uniref:Uncharacterized protein n=1 Tax=Haloarcula taiwanensis TaxID=1932004 RepID=A0A2H5A3X3_9EURY|nr:hypothetical protein [Haloarcula taiwanensis]AUG49446.1 hypothetical protein BVU17_17860 [Haloarcula taiwanensis]